MARMFLEENLKGRRIVSLDVLDTKMLASGSEINMREAFVGRTADGVRRHGKHLLIKIGDDHLYMHLGMSGSLHILERDERSPHQRFRLGLDGETLVLEDPRRFGRLGIYHRMEDLLNERGLGPDALTVSDRVFVSLMANRSGSIKPLLLDQRVVAGVGNLYADEVLFQERLHPATKVNALSREEMAGLGRSIRMVLKTSIGVRTDLSRLPEGYLLRDRRVGAPCPRCGGALSSLQIGGRRAVFCQVCQSRRMGR